ncbi:hypothetical protein VTK73DRAFT_8512 [Phialemonium thermophilum]|uniref:Cytochrome P450 n=1 Tax=Phialemonium thermophilum TaxID=223376 RepID=A0ABR3W844_9PEZI
MRAELDQLFGPDADPAVVRAQLLASGEELTHRMSYMSAVLKETLRLHPPAGTGRMAPPGTGLTVHIPDKAGGPGQEVCIDGLILYNCASIIHRDRAVYGDTADQFRPERWLGDSDISARTNSGLLPEEKSSGTAARSGTGSGVPPSAWRPFERGPRNCIGQELANLEAKVILACVIRRYDFVKVGLGELDLDDKGQPVLNSEDQYRVKSELYSTSQVTSKPADGTVVKVKFARP